MFLELDTVMSSNIQIQKTCRNCGNVFTAKTTVTKFCSHRCASQNYKKRKHEAKIQEVSAKVVHQAELNHEKIKDKEFLNINEACVLIGASRMTLYRQIKLGNIQVGKLGRRTIIKRSEIEKLFEP